MESVKTVFIGALPFKAGEELISKLVAPFGPVGRISIFADWENPTSEPYALVDLRSYHDAVEHLDGYKIGSAHLRVHLWGENGKG